MLICESQNVNEASGVNYNVIYVRLINGQYVRLINGYCSAKRDKRLYLWKFMTKERIIYCNKHSVLRKTIKLSQSNNGKIEKKSNFQIT